MKDILILCHFVIVLTLHSHSHAPAWECIPAFIYSCLFDFMEWFGCSMHSHRGRWERGKRTL